MRKRNGLRGHGDHGRHSSHGIGDCPADLDGSGDVATPDLLRLLDAIGPNTIGKLTPADLDSGADVDYDDLLLVVSVWGTCGTEPQSVPQTIQDCLDKFGPDEIEALELCIEAISGH